MECSRLHYKKMTDSHPDYLQVKGALKGGQIESIVHNKK